MRNPDSRGRTVGAQVPTVQCRKKTESGLGCQTVLAVRAILSIFVLAPIVAGALDIRTPVQTPRTAEAVSFAAAGSFFGSTVSISGDTAVVGAADAEIDGIPVGAAFIIRRDDNDTPDHPGDDTWLPEDMLTASDGTQGDYFGNSVSISGDYVVIGATGDDDAGDYSGSAYVFRRDAGIWVEDSKLTGVSHDAFGVSVSIQGTTIVVGAWGNEHAGSYSGAAYVFQQEEKNWVEVARLTSSDPAAYEGFGMSVSVSGDLILAGDPGDRDVAEGSGSVHVFRREGATWIEDAKLVPADPTNAFGYDVSLDGTSAIVGSYLDDDMGDRSGSAHVFRYNGTAWIEDVKLPISGASRGDQCGWGVAIDGDRVAVGASRDEVGLFCDAGSAYTFRRKGTLWIEEVRLSDENETWANYFGTSVAIRDDVLAVGVPGDDDAGRNAGSVHFYWHDGGSWIPQTKVTPTDTASRQQPSLSHEIRMRRVVTPTPSGTHAEIRSQLLSPNMIPPWDASRALAADRDANILGAIAATDPDECERILRVDPSATGASHGASWEDAFTDIDSALQQVEAGTTSPWYDIWVVSGTYLPSRRTYPDLPRTATFQLANLGAIYGGFSGDETSRDQRDPVANLTILSGDIAGDDDPDAPWADSNCCSEHAGLGCDSAECEATVCARDSDCCEWHWDESCAETALKYCCEACSNPSMCDNAYHVVDGSAATASALLDGLTITGGRATGTYGGGMYLYNGNVKVAHCTFYANTAEFGGGIYHAYRTLTLSDCVFEQNTAGSGGAVYTKQGTATFDDCTFRDNSAAWNGGSIYSGLSDSTLTHCTFSGNTAGNDGGAMHNRSGTSSDRTNARMTNCDFIGNSAIGRGGAVFNSCRTGSAVVRATAVDCRFLGNRASAGGGMFNEAGTGSASTIVELMNCALSGNYSDGHGGGLYNGGGISDATLTVSLVNCTFTENEATWYGGAIHNDRGSLTVDLVNSVLWANRDANGAGESSQLYNYRDESIGTMDYNCMQGWSGALGGIGNIGAAPLFVDANGPDGEPGTYDDNLRLSSDSPCLNTGDPEFVVELPVFIHGDLDGHARILCGVVDMGAYEYGIGDFDCGRTVDLFDFAYWDACMTGPSGGPYIDGCEAFDLQYGGYVDLCDYSRFLSVLEVP